jgi:hypothetical protein
MMYEFDVSESTDETKPTVGGGDGGEGGLRQNEPFLESLDVFLGPHSSSFPLLVRDQYLAS